MRPSFERTAAFWQAYALLTMKFPPKQLARLEYWSFASAPARLEAGPRSTSQSDGYPERPSGHRKKPI
jgi:hypothetical protein